MGKPKSQSWKKAGSRPRIECYILLEEPGVVAVQWFAYPNHRAKLREGALTGTWVADHSLLEGGMSDTILAAQEGRRVAGDIVRAYRKLLERQGLHHRSGEEVPTLDTAYEPKPVEDLINLRLSGAYELPKGETANDANFERMIVTVVAEGVQQALHSYRLLSREG